MHLTGVAGGILGFVILLIAYVTVILGIYCVVSYFLLQYLLTWVFKATKNYSLIIQFVIHRRKFKKWIKDQDEDQKAILFSEWATDRYTYAGNHQWDGDNDETFSTSEIFILFKQSTP